MKKGYFYFFAKHTILSLSIAIGLSTVAACIVVGALYYTERVTYKNRVLPYTYVNNKDVSGLAVTQVEALLHKELKIFNDKMYLFIFNDTEQKQISGMDLQFTYNFNAIRPVLTREKKSQIQNLYAVFMHVIMHEPTIVTIRPSYTSDVIEQYFDELDKQYGQEAKDAKFQLEGRRVVAFQIEEQGRRVDRRKTFDDFDRTLLEGTDPPTVTVSSEFQKPMVQIKDINTYGIIEKVAEGVSNYRGSSNERVHNLLRAATKLHGVLIPQGETFSYNKSVGDISIQTGYKQAYIIQDGKTVLGDGGGICQTSTTMFRAALNAGLPIVERHAHSYRVKYYENDQKPGLDATVFAPRVDFRFKNDTPAALLIQMSVDKEKKILIFTLYGTRDEREVTLSPIRVSGYRPPPEPQFIDDPTLPRGTQKQVDFAATGATSKFDYLVKRNGEVLQQRTFVSNYRPWQAIFLVGTRD
jgi:vancomycin resistance protein YoaR